MVLVVVAVCAVVLIAAYYMYGGFLANKVFQLKRDNPVPSHEMEEGVDYVPGIGTALTAGIPIFFIFQTMTDASGAAVPAWKTF